MQEKIKDDTISRQAAIDAIANCTNCGDEKTLRAYVAKHNLDNGWTGGILEAIDAIEDLPSAQPERKKGRWIFTKYYTWECSECGESPTKGTGYTQSSDELYAFCPHCGSYNGGDNQ